MKLRECKKACGYPALKGRQFCRWHALMRMSSEEQAQLARRRLNGLHSTDPSFRAMVPKSEWPNGERWCAGCQSFVPLFYCTGSRCKACASSASHAQRLLTNFGISADEYTRLYKLQGGRCAICRNKSRTIRFAVDHDHQTGAVRGLLCKRCNHDLLGGGHDSVELLWAAIKYLLSPPASYGPVFTDKVAMAALEERLAIVRLQAQPVAVEPQDPPF